MINYLKSCVGCGSQYSMVAFQLKIVSQSDAFKFSATRKIASTCMSLKICVLDSFCERHI